MAIIEVPRPLRAYTEGMARVPMESRSVSEALGRLVELYPAVEKHLYAAGQIRKSILIFIDDVDIRYADGMESTVRNDSTITILPALSGGKSVSC